MAFKEFISELNGGRVEGELVKTFIYSIITSFIVLAIVWFIRLRAIDGFIGKQGYFLFFAILSYALLVPAVRHVRAYGQMACMPGMMVGMMLGSVAGFLSGFFVAATNGMFVGSVFGMIVGIFFGTWLGSCCGIMGFLEGVMAGFMGSLMGAMTAFMLINDNLRAAAVIVFAVSAVMIVGLNYMIYKEMRESDRQKREDHFWTIALSFILTLAATWLVAFGPRSGLFG